MSPYEETGLFTTSHLAYNDIQFPLQACDFHAFTTTSSSQTWSSSNQIMTTFPQSKFSGGGGNSTSDEIEDYVCSVDDERKRRRMISNRESARRSRMRKQRYIDELWSQVTSLRAANQGLLDKLNSKIESHDRILQENAKLKIETSSLRRQMMIGSGFNQ